MRNFKQIETKINMNQNDRLLKGNNFITRRAQESKSIQHLCSPLNVFLFFWLLIVIMAAVWVVVYELIPNL